MIKHPRKLISALTKLGAFNGPKSPPIATVTQVPQSSHSHVHAPEAFLLRPNNARDIKKSAFTNELQQVVLTNMHRQSPIACDCGQVTCDEPQAILDNLTSLMNINKSKLQYNCGAIHVHHPPKIDSVDKNLVRDLVNSENFLLLISYLGHMFALIRDSEGYFLLDPYLQYQRIAAGQAFLRHSSTKKCPDKKELLAMSRNWDLEQDPDLINKFIEWTDSHPHKHFVCHNTNAKHYQKLCWYLGVPKKQKVPFLKPCSMIQFTGNSCYSIWLPVFRFLAGEEFKVPEFKDSLELSCKLINGDDLDLDVFL